MMSLHEAQGSAATGGDYEALIQNGMAQIRNLEDQNAELRAQQQGLDVLSEKYQDLQKQITSNEEAILDMKVSQEEWNDAVLDLKIAEIQKYRDELTKTNDQYQKQKQLQEALLDLEKAKSQRTQRVYREGIGFVYEADQEAIQSAQEDLDQVLHDQTIDKLDDIITAIEDAKSDTNVYDADGNLLGTRYELPDVSDLSNLLNTYSANSISNYMADQIRKTAYDQVIAGAQNTQKNLSMSIGDIVVQGADNPNALAEALLEEFPNAMLQALYSK